MLIFGPYERELSGAEPATTNNRMEMMGALEGLRALKERCHVKLYTDSAYLFRAFTEGWIDRWMQNGWKTASKKPVENKDLWEALLEMDRKHAITWHKVKGHSTNELNNRVDELAVKARLQLVSK